MLEMYRLLAIAKYDERYVIPAAHTEQAKQLEELGCSLDYDEGPGMYGSGPFGEASGVPVPVAVENFHALKAPPDLRGRARHRPDKQGRVNLLNWDGKGAPTGLFPTTSREDELMMDADSGARRHGPSRSAPCCCATPSESTRELRAC